METEYRREHTLTKSDHDADVVTVHELLHGCTCLLTVL